MYTHTLGFLNSITDVPLGSSQISRSKALELSPPLSYPRVHGHGPDHPPLRPSYLIPDRRTCVRRLDTAYVHTNNQVVSVLHDIFINHPRA